MPDRDFEAALDVAEAIFDKMLDNHLDSIYAEMCVAGFLTSTGISAMLPFDALLDTVGLLTSVIYHMDACDRVN